MDGAPKKSYRDLIVWQRSIETCVALYRLTQKFPREELYGLTHQVRRAAVSIPSNIAEGYRCLTREQYRHFLGIAQASNFELQTQLTLARELAFATADEVATAESLSCEVGKMLTAMLKKL
ncbi:MAG: four helix bundle protein [Acidobacteriaceae bacterium]|jgi:four helix bundle protein